MNSRGRSVGMRSRPGFSRSRSIALLLLAGAATAYGTGAEESAHLVITERNLKQLESRLKDAGGRGYRVVGAADGSAGYIKSSTLRLDLAPTGKENPIQYRIVDGQYSTTLEKAVNKAALEGYRILPIGVLKKTTPNVLSPRDVETVVLIMERDLSLPPNEYKLISPGTPEQFSRQVGKQYRNGFQLTGVCNFDGGWLLAVVERPITEQERVEQPKRDDPHYLAIDQRDRRKLFDDVGDAAKRGYRIVATIHRGFTGGGNVVLLEKAAEPGRPYSYFFLGSPTTAELQDLLNEGGAAGYRFLPGLDPLVELIMERPPDQRDPWSYRVVAANAEAQIAAEVADANQDGYSVVGTFANALVLEKTDAGRTPATAGGGER